MRTWTRALVGTLCGRCGESIRKGSPVFEITFGRQLPQGAPVEGAERPANWAVTKHRCEHCAGESVPADLAPLVERVSVIEPSTKIGKSRQFTGLSGMARDWKQIQSGGDR